jgi:hypothetical protein
MVTVALAMVVAGTPVSAELIRVEIISRQPVLGGRSFGLAGAYEIVTAIAYFAVDPASPANGMVTDVHLAPRDASGRVTFSADLRILRPISPERGNGTLLLDIANRGREVVTGLNFVRAPLDPDLDSIVGDGFLMRQGFTIAWVGWQFDVLAPGLRLMPPVATEGGSAIVGEVQARFMVEEPQLSVTLSGPYPVLHTDARPGELHVRSASDSISTQVPRGSWRYARVSEGEVVPDASSVYLSTGFEPGFIYDLVYASSEPPLSGLGFAAVRDFVAYAKAGSDDLVDVTRAIGVGWSQSGRFLRDFVYQGFNKAETGEQVFDGLMPVIAGGGRGFFNYRFAQPGLLSTAPPRGLPVPADRFPFADLPQRDPFSGVEVGLLDRAVLDGVVPKIFYINASGEYDDRAAALIHTEADGSSDAILVETTRVYMVSGAPHGSAAAPAPSPGQQAYANPNNHRWVTRALLVAMQDWIAEGKEPPASRYPSIADGTLVRFDPSSFPSIPGIEVPPRIYSAQALDFGGDSDRGILQLPPKVLGTYPPLIPAVDSDGNELGGIRMPEVSVPLATYAGWNLTESSFGSYLTILAGSYIPFPRTVEDAEASGDPRLSIEARYHSRAEYLGLYAAAIGELVSDGLVLAEDAAALLGVGEARWAFHQSDPGVKPSRDER